VLWVYAEDEEIKEYEERINRKLPREKYALCLLTSIIKEGYWKLVMSSVA